MVYVALKYSAIYNRLPVVCDYVSMFLVFNLRQCGASAGSTVVAEGPDEADLHDWLRQTSIMALT